MFRFASELRNVGRLAGSGIQRPVRYSSSRQPVPNATCRIKYASVMLEAMCSGGHKALEGVDAMDLKYGIDSALEDIKNHLKCRAGAVSTFEQIVQVGTKAADGDGKIGELIAEAMEKLGKGGLFFISEKKKSGKEKEIDMADLEFVNSNVELEFVNGMKLNWDSISHPFIENQNQACVLKNPAVLIQENKMLDDNVIKQAIELIRYRRPLLIVAESMETEVVGSLVLDPVCAKTKLCVVKPPESQTNRKDIMEDLAILTGGQVANGKTSCNFLPLVLGSCKEARVLGTEMVILGGSGHQNDIEERCEQLRSAITRSTSDFEVKLLEERLSKLSHGAAIFKVDAPRRVARAIPGIGGIIDPDRVQEVRKMIKRVSNGLNAAKAAVEEGIIPGGGVALLHASKELDKLQMTNSDRKFGVQLLQHALMKPLCTIASTSGIEGSAVVEKLLQEDNLDLGYDPLRGEYVDMMKSGIVDSLKLVIDELDDVQRSFVKWMRSKQRRNGSKQNPPL